MEQSIKNARIKVPQGISFWSKPQASSKPDKLHLWPFLQKNKILPHNNFGFRKSDIDLIKGTSARSEIKSHDMMKKCIDSIFTIFQTRDMELLSIPKTVWPENLNWLLN